VGEYRSVICAFGVDCCGGERVLGGLAGRCSLSLRAGSLRSGGYGSNLLFTSRSGEVYAQSASVKMLLDIFWLACMR